jgi:thiamine-phosphate pyrophosphorylase
VISAEERARLYLVTPAALDPAAFRDQLAAALDAGPVACVQLRLKDVSDDDIRRACNVLRPVAQVRGVAFLLNDRPDLVAETDCDGVHVGQQDTPYAQARALVGPDRIVGVTCHSSRHLAIEAAEAGADYVAFGAFYPTTTKVSGYTAEPELLRWWNETMTVPSVAIGGITPANCAPLIEAGANFLAVVSAVWNNPEGPAVAVRAFHRAIANAEKGERAAL